MHHEKFSCAALRSFGLLMDKSPEDDCPGDRGENAMTDIVYVGISVAFFSVAAVYVYFCDKVR